MIEAPDRQKQAVVLGDFLADRLFARLREEVPLTTLRALARPAAAAAARSWDGRGHFAPYVMQRARWSIFDSLRKAHFVTRKPRDPSAEALLATERAADAMAVASPPPPADVDEAILAVHAFVARAASAFTIGLDAAEVEQIVDEHADPEAHTERLRIRRAVAALPEAERAVIERHGYAGETFDEIAATEGTSRTAVFRRYASALEKLRRIFADQAR